MSTRPFNSTTAIALLLAASLPALRAQAPTTPPLVPTAPAPAQTGPTVPPAAAAPAPVQAGPADAGKLADKPAAADPSLRPGEEAKGSATKAKDSTGKDSVSVDFRDQDIRDILANVADLFEINLVMPETLQGKQTIKLRDVTWRQIFTNVLSPVNYTFIEDGNIIKIVSNESLTQEPVTTDVFLINYARAADILPTITSLVDAAAGGKIVVDTRSNSLVITERPTRISKIRPIIEQLDRATDQVMIETKFVEVTNSDLKNIGVNWSSLAGYQLKAGGLESRVTRDRGQRETQGFDASRGFDNRNTITSATGTNNRTDSTQDTGSNNSSSVTSTNGVPTATSTTGTSGRLTNTINNGTTATTGNETNNTLNDTYNALSSLANDTSTARALTAVFSASDFTLVLSALQTQQSSKIINNPTVVTLNNTEAVINVGQERPIPKYAYNQQTGSFEVNGFEYKPIGILLKVTPQVNSRGFIKLTVEPEVSQSTRDATFNGASIPVVDTRKAKTQVSLKDGFTMGIGGLITTQTGNTTNKVPVLGSIPFLGRLFKSDNKNLDQTNLIIFITAKTISAEGGTTEQIFESSRVRQLELRREDLPGYRDGSSPFLPPVPPPGELKAGEKAPAKKSFFSGSDSEAKK